MRKDVGSKRMLITRWPGKCTAECTKEGFTVEWSTVFPLKKDCEINGENLSAPPYFQEHFSFVPMIRTSI